MKCENHKEALVAYVFQEMTADEKTTFEKHLKTCETCRQELAEIKQTKESLAQWPDEPSPVGFKAPEKYIGLIPLLKKRSVQSIKGIRFAWIIPATVLGLFLILSIFNFEANMQDGNWHFSFSLLPRSEKKINEDMLVQMVNQMQQDNIETMARMIQSSEYRQSQKLDNSLNTLALSYEQKRKEDLQMINTGFHTINRVAQDQYQQTNEVLHDLIRFTSVNSTE